MTAAFRKPDPIDHPVDAAIAAGVSLGKMVEAGLSGAVPARIDASGHLRIRADDATAWGLKRRAARRLGVMS